MKHILIYETIDNKIPFKYNVLMKDYNSKI